MIETTYSLQTNATNRRVREIITAVKNKGIIPRPDFQRRLVWTNRDRVAFIDTILQRLPFPEIYVCAGEVDPDTAAGTEWLVDGQQRVSAIVGYFNAEDDLKLPPETPAYRDLDKKDQADFLEYTVVVRDLGHIPIDHVREVFQRINSTNYGLNAMELANARFDGAIKKAAESLADVDFYSEHSIFSAADIRRMVDVSFQLSLLITLEQGYFNDNDEHESYLTRYNDEYPHAAKAIKRVKDAIAFIESLDLSARSRWFKKADIFSLIVEVDRIVHEEGLNPDTAKISKELTTFEKYLERLRRHDALQDVSNTYREFLSQYAHATTQGSNHRNSRSIRGSVLGKLLRHQAEPRIEGGEGPEGQASSRAL
jgi:hypothetical protein